MYDVTLQSSGFTLDDPTTFSNRIFRLINIGLGSDEDSNEIEENHEESYIEEVNNESSMEQVD
jgi:molecular chaperone HtpG